MYSRFPLIGSITIIHHTHSRWLRPLLERLPDPDGGVSLWLSMGRIDVYLSSWSSAKHEPRHA